MTAPIAPARMFPDPEVWLVDLAASAEALLAIENATPRLSADDLAKGERGRDPAARRERQVAHIALRVLIERAFGPAWRGVPYRLSAHGKPTLPGCTGAFSLSHVEGAALIALVSSGTIGADLERRRPVSLALDRRRELVAAAAALAPGLPLPCEAEARFLQAWVRLEAVAKAEGRGIGSLLTSLGVTRGGSRAHGSDLPHAARAHAADRPSFEAAALQFAVHDGALGEGVFASVALGVGAPDPRWRRLPADAAAIAALAV